MVDLPHDKNSETEFHVWTDPFSLDFTVKVDERNSLKGLPNRVGCLVYRKNNNNKDWRTTQLVDTSRTGCDLGGVIYKRLVDRRQDFCVFRLTSGRDKKVSTRRDGVITPKFVEVKSVLSSISYISCLHN